MKRTVLIIAFSALLGTSSAMAASDEVLKGLRQEAIELQTPSDSQIQTVEMIDMGCSACKNWMRDVKQWNEGYNEKGEETFYVYTDSAVIAAPPGHPQYIVSRQNAYAKAFLKAKGKIIQNLETAISREIKYSEKEGKFLIEEQQPDDETQTAQAEESSLSAIKRKTLALVNAYLDEKLKQKGVEPNPQNQPDSRKIDQVAEVVLNSDRFSEIVKSSAQSQLKGVRRIYVHEAVKAGKQGEICVVALYSPKTMAMADAIFKDPSLAPIGIPAKSIREQVPDFNKPEGVLKLISTFGTEMLRDEHGQFHVIAYAQSAPKSESLQSLKLAEEKARQRAMGELRGFAQEYAAMDSMLQESEKSSELASAMENYESAEAFEQTLSSISPLKAFSGVSSYGSWVARHPQTNQIIAGAIVEWSPKSSTASARIKDTMNSTEPASAVSKGQQSQTFAPGAYKAQKGYEGSASGGSGNEDF